MSTMTMIRHFIVTRFTALRPRALAAGVLGAGLLGAGCGGVEYGPPTTPTSTQQRAVAALHDVAARTALAGEGKADAATLAGVHGLVATLADTALVMPIGSSPAGALAPIADLHCTSGAAATGFRYAECTLDEGKLSGQVDVSSAAIQYDLQLQTMWVELDSRLQGELTVATGRIAGTLDFSTGGEIAVYDSASGSATTRSIGGPRTWVTWDVAVGKSPACIESGTVRVQVQAGGGERNTRFTFSGCDRVTVENSR